jgi:hypothetical protein
MNFLIINKIKYVSGICISKKFLFSIFFFILSGMYSLQAQTCSCTQHVSVSNATNYTVTAGQTLCIDSGAVASGKITIKGGNLCISGSVLGAINDGTTSTIYSYANGGSITINKNGGLQCSGNFNMGKLKLTVNDKGVFNVLGDLTLSGSGSSVSNKGVINVLGKIIMKSGSVLDNKWIMNSGVVENSGVTVTGGGKLNTKNN